MSISIAEAAAKMTSSATSTPETVAKVLVVVSQIGSDLTAMTDLTRASGHKLREVMDGVAKAQLSLTTRVKEQDTALVQHLDGLSTKLSGLLDATNKYDHQLTQGVASALKVAAETSSSLANVQRELSDLEQDHRQVVQPALITLREAGARLQTRLKKVHLELNGLRGELNKADRDARDQVALLRESVARAKGQLQAGHDTLSSAGDRAVSDLDESLRQGLQSLSLPRMEIAVAGATEGLQRDVRKGAETAVLDLTASLRTAASACQDLETLCLPHSASLDEQSKGYQQGPELRTLLQSSDQLLTHLGKLA